MGGVEADVLGCEGETFDREAHARQLAAQRGKCLVVNLPGSPRSIDLCLDSIMAAVPYCLELMGAARIDTDPSADRAHRANVEPERGESIPPTLAIVARKPSVPRADPI